MVQLPLVAHLCAMAVCAALADLVAPGSLWLGALAYLLVQVGRALHELGHAYVGRKSGLNVERVRLGPVRMAADFPNGTVWSAEPAARRRTAAAGALAQAVFGLVLVATSVVWWLPGAAETVWLIGLIHLAAGPANLLPLPGSDGAYLVGRAWRVRPGALGLLPLVLLQAGVPLWSTAQRFASGWTHAYLASFGSLGDLVWLGLAVAVSALLVGRVIDGANGADSGVYISRSVRSVR